MSTGSSGFKGIHPGANPNSLISELGCSHSSWAGEVSALHPDPCCTSWVEEAMGAKAATAEHRKQTKTPAQLTGLANTSNVLPWKSGGGRVRLLFDT